MWSMEFDILFFVIFNQNDIFSVFFPYIYQLAVFKNSAAFFNPDSSYQVNYTTGSCLPAIAGYKCCLVVFTQIWINIRGNFL